MVKSSLAALLLCLFCSFVLCGQATPPRETAPDESMARAELTIPNGTPVILRFSQPVVGVPESYRMHAVDHAHKGDHVRLVVAEDIRIGNVVVVKKGSLAEATVAEADMPSKYDESGLRLKFEWMKSVNDQKIPIRQKRKGNGKESKKFPVYLFRTSTGTFLGFGMQVRGFGDAFQHILQQEMGQRWTIIPVGTRVRAYVNGSISLDAMEVSKALAAFPAQNPTATVTIYREKGPAAEQPHVVCDEKDLGGLSQWQYFLLEMEPGKHRCFSKLEEKFEFSVAAGEDFYMKLHRSKMSGKWELKGIDSAAGEDAIANSVLVEIPEKPPQQN